MDRRSRILHLVFTLALLGIWARLFYWQVIRHTQLQAEADQQYTRVVPLAAERGEIALADGTVLVGNQNVFRFFAQPNLLASQAAQLSRVLAPLLAADEPASTAAEQLQQTQNWQQDLAAKLGNPQTKWVTLKSRINESTKNQIAALKVFGLGFDAYQARSYPEASLAANIAGFVGKDKNGVDQGYFGVEGALDRELRGQDEKQNVLKDALGFHLWFDPQPTQIAQNGRNVTLTIRRDIQFMVEQELQQGLAKYGATAGEVTIMDPATGHILAMASWPSYDPAHFSQYDPSLYKNPALTDTYEPGSIFKILTVAAGIDTGAITPDTQCPDCTHAKTIGDYTIKTWNDQYHPNITMTNALAESDNVAMIFVAQLLGQDRFLDYVHRFGIGDATQIELQEDTSTPVRKDKEWKPIDLATASFGQGIVTNSLQMVRAVGAIANGGLMMQPTVVSKVADPTTGSEVNVQPVSVRQVVSPQTAAAVTQMMVYTADHGEAKWTASKTHLVAAKTGTAQVPISGHYDSTKTIASFIGFAPPDHPKFVMLVKLREPTESQWASETAAPLWYSIANKLFLLLNIPADR